MVVELHDSTTSSFKNVRSEWTRKMLKSKTYSDDDAKHLNMVGRAYKQWRESLGLPLSR